MIVLDASVIIAHWDSADAHHPQANELLLRSSGEEIAASPVTLAEVLVVHVRSGRLDAARQALKDLEVLTLPLDDDAAVGLALLRSSTGLKLPDCCVLLAAEQRGASIATFDARVAAAARARGHAVLGVR